MDELFALRQELRQVRDEQRVFIAEEITNAQLLLHSEGINAKRLFDTRINDLKHQLDEIVGKSAVPSVRIQVAELREKVSELKYYYTMARAERDHRDAVLATDRYRRQAQSQQTYENLEMEVCKAIRAKDGFRELGFPNPHLKKDNGTEDTERRI